MLQPVLRLEGAAGNGSDLELPANVTADGRALTAVTPAHAAPLAAGNHTLRLSLNGQFAGGRRPTMVRRCSLSALPSEEVPGRAQLCSLTCSLGSA